MSNKNDVGKKKYKLSPMKFTHIFHYMDSSGKEVEYDATDKSKEEFPEELRAAIEAKSEEFQRKIVLPAFNRWLDGLSPEEQATLKAAARSSDPAIQEQFKKFLLNWYDTFWGRKKKDDEEI